MYFRRLVVVKLTIARQDIFIHIKQTLYIH